MRAKPVKSQRIQLPRWSCWFLVYVACPQKHRKINPCFKMGLGTSFFSQPNLVLTCFDNVLLEAIPGIASWKHRIVPQVLELINKRFVLMDGHVIQQQLQLFKAGFS